MTETFRKTELPNGLRIVTERIPNVRSVSIGFWVTVGSRNETVRENGISHFIEHMAFKGTQKRSARDIAMTIERGGGHVNAFTSRELTCFYVHVLDEKVPEAMDLLADILKNSVYAPEEMEKEKSVILDEIRDHEDMPDDLAHEYFLRELFPGHSLGRPILGSPENVRSFTREKVKSFVAEQYLPRNILITAAGNLKHGALVKLAREQLSFKSRPKRPAAEKIRDAKSSFKRYPRPIQQAHLVLGTRSIPYRSSHRFTLAVMNAALGGGMSSRLFQNIREKHGIAYAVYSFAESLTDTGVMGVYLATEPNRVDRAREMVLQEIRQICESPVEGEELEGVKTQLKGNIMLGLESVPNRMMRLARMEIYLRKFVSLDDVSAMIDEVTGRRVQNLAKKLFENGHLVTAVVEPENGAAGK